MVWRGWGINSIDTYSLYWKVMGKVKVKTDRDLERIGINPLIWYMHFRKRPDKATCKDCVDYISGVCSGGKDPIECMKEKSKESLIFIGNYF